MRLVHFADLHLDTAFKWAPPAVARARRQELQETLNNIVDLAIEQQADALCCGGDLYEHELVEPDTAEVLRSAFERLHPVPVLIAPGNHDWLAPASIYRQTRWSPNVRVFSGSRLEPHVLQDGFTIWGAAHRAPANTPSFLESFRVDRGGVNVGLFHGSLRSGLPFQEEGKQPHAPFDESDISDSGLQHTLVGHFHSPKAGQWFTYPGNPYPLAFGETGERGAVTVDFASNGTVERTWHTVTDTRVVDVVVDVSGCASLHEIRDVVRNELAPRSGIARVTVTGDLDKQITLHSQDLQDLAPHLDALVPRLGELQVAYDLDSIKAERTVRGQFVRDVLDASLDDDERRRVLVTGLRALAGRADLEVR